MYSVFPGLNVIVCDDHSFRTIVITVRDARCWFEPLKFLPIFALEHKTTCVSYGDHDGTKRMIIAHCDIETRKVTVHVVVGRWLTPPPDSVCVYGYGSFWQFLRIPANLYASEDDHDSDHAPAENMNNNDNEGNVPNPDPENENNLAIDNNDENNPAVMRIRAQEMAELNDQDNEDISSDDNASSDDSAIEIVNLVRKLMCF